MIGRVCRSTSTHVSPMGLRVNASGCPRPLSFGVLVMLLTLASCSSPNFNHPEKTEPVQDSIQHIDSVNLDSNDVSGFYTMVQGFQWWNALTTIIIFRDATLLMSDLGHDSTMIDPSGVSGSWTMHGDSIHLLCGKREFIFSKSDRELVRRIGRMGTVEFFDAMFNGKHFDKSFDEEFYLYTLSRDQRLRRYAVVFHPDLVRNKYAEYPEYKSDLKKLDRDINRSYAEFKKLDSYISLASKYRSPSNYAESRGIWSTPEADHLSEEEKNATMDERFSMSPKAALSFRCVLAGEVHAVKNGYRFVPDFATNNGVAVQELATGIGKLRNGEHGWFGCALHSARLDSIDAIDLLYRADSSIHHFDMW